MDETSILIKEIDLPALATQEGIQLRSSGKYHTGLCPFHPEKTPSFTIDANKNRFNCYGCHEYGDPVDFVQKMHGLTFPDALKYLGLETGPHSKAQLREIKQRIRAAEARRRQEKAQRCRERDLAWTLGKSIRIAESIMADSGNSDWETKVLILQHLETLKYQHSIFIDGDIEDRAALVKDLAAVSPFPRGELFDDDFDYGRWNWEATQKQTE